MYLALSNTIATRVEFTIVDICKSSCSSCSRHCFLFVLIQKCFFFVAIIISLDFCVWIRLSCRSREAQVVATSQKTPRGRERARKLKAGLNPQRLRNARRRNQSVSHPPQIHTEVPTKNRTVLKLTLYSWELSENKQTCSSLADLVMFSWSCGGADGDWEENHRDRETQGSGSFPHIISSH